MKHTDNIDFTIICRWFQRDIDGDDGILGTKFDRIADQIPDDMLDTNAIAEQSLWHSGRLIYLLNAIHTYISKKVSIYNIF